MHPSIHTLPRKSMQLYIVCVLHKNVEDPQWPTPVHLYEDLSILLHSACLSICAPGWHALVVGVL